MDIGDVKNDLLKLRYGESSKKSLVETNVESVLTSKDVSQISPLAPLPASNAVEANKTEFAPASLPSNQRTWKTQSSLQSKYPILFHLHRYQHQMPSRQIKQI